MFIQFKHLLLFLMLAVSVVNHGQENIVYNTTDSLQDVILEQLKKETEFLQKQINLEAIQLKTETDSLDFIVNKLESKSDSLGKINEILVNRLAETTVHVSENKALISSERTRMKKVLLFMGTALILLILLAVVFLFIAINKQRIQSDRKIDALREFTVSEIKDTRTSILGKLKKRLKKLSKGEKRKAKGDPSTSSGTRRKKKGKRRK